MSAPIGPGDWVECVDAGVLRPCARCNWWHRARPELQQGALYQIAGVGAPDEDGEVSYRLVGVEHAEGGAFFEDRFRPIYRRNDGLIADLLRRAKEPLRTETPEPVRARAGTRVRPETHPAFRDEP